MFRHILSTCALLSILINTSIAEVVIEKKNRVPNLGHGVCSWSSIEMSGLQFGITELKGLTERRDKQSRELVNKIRYELRIGPRGVQVVPVIVQEERLDNGGSIWRIEEELKKLGVGYTAQVEGKTDKSMLFDGVKDGMPGVIVGIRHYAYTPTDEVKDGHKIYQIKENSHGYHAVLLVDINDTWASYYDPNDVSLPWVVTRKWFDDNWDGSAVVLTVQPLVGPILKVSK